MRTRWFGDKAGEERLGGTLLRLVGEVARMLDRLHPPAVAPGDARVDAGGSAVVLPHRGVPGCSLVVQVAEWSSSIGCWWSVGSDPLAGPAFLELSAELPLGEDGLGRAVAWLEGELRRPVVERVRRYGLARRRQWFVVMDDEYELPVRQRWLPGWRDGAGDGSTASLRRLDAAWLLGVAAAAAALHWCWNLLWLEVAGLAWVDRAGPLLDVVAFAALFVWFGVAGLDRPARVRAPLLAGLPLAALGQAVELFAAPTAPPSPTDSVPRALGLFLRGWSPALFGVAALACYLAGFLGVPGRGALRPRWPVAGGLAWGVDLAVGLRWLAPIGSAEGAAGTLAWYGLFASAMRAVAVGLAIALLLVVLDRRPQMARPAARASRTGGVLLVLAWSAAVQAGLSRLAVLAPPLAFAIFSAPMVLGWFAGSALVAVAAAAPATPGSGAGRPAPRWSRARRPGRGPGARPGGARPRP